MNWLTNRQIAAYRVGVAPHQGPLLSAAQKRPERGQNGRINIACRTLCWDCIADWQLISTAENCQQADGES